MFIISSDALRASRCALPADEAHHALHVLRLKQGAHIQLTDGKGTIASAILQPESRKSASADIVERRNIPPRQPRISVYLGMLKSRQRLENALEKLTEIGVDDIILMDTEHTERQKFRMDRARGVLVSAVKQSQSAWMPGLRHYTFETAIQHFAQQSEGHHILLAAHEKKEIILEDGLRREGNRFPELRTRLYQDFGPELSTTDKNKALRLHIFIGPEGGFSLGEVTQMLRFRHARPLWLGDVRLRAETAAMQIAGLFRFGL
ncbi:MAG: RsmE family RNA methyltransferase [Cyclonatronaceae bacterium]